MKNIITSAIVVLTLTLVACTSGGSAFTGKWKPVKGSIIVREDAILEIAKDGDQYNLMHENPHTIMGTLQYDKSSDCLTGNIDGHALIVKQDKATGHIILTPPNMGYMDQPIVLERVK